MTVLAAATPRLAVTYGSFAISETNGCVLCSEYDSEDTSVYGSFYIEFRVRLLSPTGVVATDDAAFAALVNAVETNLRIPRQTLLVQIGSSTVRNWSFSGTQTAILIQPELKLLENNCRDYRYGLRVRCQFQGNIPSNTYRRESLTTIGSSLRERRTCVISATWTSSNGVTAYQQFLNNGNTFFNAYLPANTSDQHSNTGTWVLADQNPAFQDEDSLLTVTRTYWECYAGRRDSTVTTITTIGNRRVCTVPCVFVASGGNTALQNYASNGNAYFNDVLPTPVTSGAWVLIDEEPGYNDQNGILTVVRVYHEVVNGLREYNVQVTADAANIRTVVVTGAYYATGSTSALTNYTNNIAALVASAIAAAGVTNYESHSIPKVTGYDTQGLRYFFTWTLIELAYPQGTSWDDPNVTFELLEVKVNRPFDAQAITASNPVTRLQRCTARFVAAIDKDSSGGNDPVALWDASLRAHVVTAVTSKLGAGVTSVQVEDEVVGAGLNSNTLTGTLSLLVTADSLAILWVRLVQRITQYPGREFVPLADGTAFSFYPYRKPPRKEMYREGSCEYVVGKTPPVLFDAGDNTVSGFGFIDTGVTAQDSVDAQDADGSLDVGDNWFIDGMASPPYAYWDEPMDRGDGGSPFQTVIHRQVENWIYVETLAAGTDIGAGDSGVSDE